MASSRFNLSTWALPCALLLLVLYARPAHAFGAGNIASVSKIEGQNWRHGDIEDTLLALFMTRAGRGKKFSKLDVKRVYFGNWLRDYSQAVDVGTVKMVSAEAIRILLWILGFLSFGFGTKEFEVTRDRLGCYRPEEHIDNPKDYADNLDARQYDRRLRGPVDERRELAIDERTGLKNYIASEDKGITTSAGLVRDLYRRCIDLGRRYNRTQNKDDLYEAFRLLGTANHCLEDYSAHSNYVELCLIEMGERDVFPHVGRRTQVNVRGARGPVWPLITGTFGGVDFLHSVMGELSDKATQSEMQELEGTIANSTQHENASLIKDLLNQLPSGLFGGNDEAGKVDELQANAAAAQMQNMNISPKEPEAFTRQVQEMSKQIYPVLEFHDEIMHSITETIENIPILPDLLEKLQEQMSIFVFSLIAPYVLPIVSQIKTELATGSSEVIQSSREKQLIVFQDDNCSDPTHSMLSKDHFSNILNEPAGKVASQVIKWVVPQIVECWDNDRADVDRTISRIIAGVFHHPALRQYGDDGAADGRGQMFQVVEQWWNGKSEREKSDLRDKLSRRGVENGRNHKEGVHDSGHGCGKPLGQQNALPQSPGAAISGALGAGVLGGLNQAMGGESGFGGGSSSGYQSPGQNKFGDQVGKTAGDAVGGGILGSIVGGVVGGVGASLLGGALSGDGDEHKTYKKTGYNDDGSYTTSYTETASRPPRQQSYGRQEESYGGQQQGYSQQQGYDQQQQQGYGRQEESHGPRHGEGEERHAQAQYSRTEYPGGGRRDEYSRYEQDGSSGAAGYGFQQTVSSGPTQSGGYERREERQYESSAGQWAANTRTEGVGQSGEYYSQETRRHGGRRSDDEDGEDEERKRREKAEKKARKKAHGHHDDDSSDDDRRGQHGGGGGGGGGGGYGEGRREEYGGGREGGYGEERGYGGGGGGGYGGAYDRQ
ncbi:Het-C-domain-containing protein [Trichodelitschia bisporula]|uniref:Het-C-domain-containing protein n=1 Tax=Trichodelitschia bisporula TaxID=703511 RepID=A0A6G1I0B7_9PEZI|nr:Het-C-domain-containing protein [Trichodelitschia bisporula]